MFQLAFLLVHLVTPSLIKCITIYCFSICIIINHHSMFLSCFIYSFSPSLTHLIHVHICFIICIIIIYIFYYYSLLYIYCYYLFTVSVFTYVERSCLAASSDTCDNKIGYGSCSCSTTYCNSQARISVFTPLLLLTALVVWAQRS